MKKCMTFIALVCVGMIAAGTASAQITNSFFGADPGTSAALGNFLVDTTGLSDDDDDGLMNLPVFNWGRTGGSSLTLRSC